MRLGAYPCVLVAGTVAADAYGHDGDQRAASPSLRVRERLPRAARAGGARPQRHVAGQAPRRDGRAPRAPVLRRLPVPPRVQEPPASRRTRSSRASCARRSSGRPPACGAKGASCRRARRSSTRSGDGRRLRPGGVVGTSRPAFPGVAPPPPSGRSSWRLVSWRAKSGLAPPDGRLRSAEWRPPSVRSCPPRAGATCPSAKAGIRPPVGRSLSAQGPARHS